MRDNRLMKAVRLLVESGNDIYCADMAKSGEHMDGWLDFYSHEPFAKSNLQIINALRAIKPFISSQCENGGFEVRLFCPDGYMKLNADGSAVEDD